MGQSTETLKRDIAQTRSDLSGTLDAIGDRVSPGRIMERKKNRMVEGVRNLKERVMGTAIDAGHAMSESMHDVGDAVHGVGDAATGLPVTAKRQVQGAPLAAGAISFGVGFLIAAAIPPSQKEKELSTQLIDKAEPVKEQLTETAHEMVDRLKEPASQAVAEVKDTAADAVQEVKSTASNAAHEVADHAKDTAQDVKDQTKT
jgi:gas vesicle protein